MAAHGAQPLSGKQGHGTNVQRDHNAILDDAERLYLSGQHSTSFALVQRLLTDLTNSSSKSSPLYTAHACTPNCVCEATVVLGIQNLFESRQFDAVDPFLSRLYGSVASLPYPVFLTWYVYGPACLVQDEHVVAVMAITRCFQHVLVLD